MSAPWHANFPAGKSTPPEITAAELAALSNPGRDYIVVDVRRTDIDVSHLPWSSSSFPQTEQTLELKKTEHLTVDELSIVGAPGPPCDQHCPAASFLAK